MNIPGREECKSIIARYKVPANIIEHSEIVCKVAEETADKLIGKGIEVNKNLLIAAALLHDVLRHKENHVVEGTNLIKSLGYPEVAEVMRKHTIYWHENEKVLPVTIEEKILLYSDDCVMGNKIVSLKERIEESEKRNKIDLSEEFKICKEFEKQLVQ